MHIYSAYMNVFVSNIYLVEVIYFNMKYLMLMCKGFIIGVAKIIPGVSGAIIAISFGVYERLVKIMSKPLHIKIDDLKFLISLLIGAAFGIGLLSKCVKWCLEMCYLPTMLLFVGLIIGGIPEITTEITKNKINGKIVCIFIVSFMILYYLINLSGGENVTTSNNLIYFFIGVIESLTTIIPGVSGTAIFMALGWYETLLSIFESITNFSIDVITFLLFFSGFIFSTILISKLITWLFTNKKVIAYTSVLGFMSASLVIMLEDTFSQTFSLIDIIIGVCLFTFGIWVTKKINIFFSKL